MTTTPTPQRLSLAMSMIDRSRWWLPAQVIDLIRGFTIDSPDRRNVPCLLSDRDLSSWIYGDDTHHRNMNKLVGEMAKQRILEFVPAAGSRPRAWSINGAFSQWRDVPWRLDRELVMWRLNGTFAEQNTARNPVSAVLMNTALNDFVPSRSTRQYKVFVPYPSTRHKGSATAVPINTAQAISPAVPINTAQSETGAVPINTAQSLDSSLSSEVADEFSSLSEKDRELFDKICAVMIREFPAKGRFIAKGPKNTVMWLVQKGATEQELMDLIAATPRHLGIPLAASWIYNQWKIRDVDVPNRSVIEDDAEVIDLNREAQREQQRTNLLRRVEECQDAGDEELAEHFRAQLEQLEA